MIHILCIYDKRPERALSGLFLGNVTAAAFSVGIAIIEGDGT
jgi:hypothetical protein